MKINGEIKNRKLYLTKYNNYEKQLIETILTFKPKSEYDKETKDIKLYDIINDVIIVNCGFLDILKKYTSIEYKENNIINKTINLSDINENILSGIKLFDFQKFCIYKCINREFGCVISPTGSGKTEIILAIIKQLYNQISGVCIIVPNVLLAEQFAQRAIKRGINKKDIGIYCGQEKTHITKIIVFVINSLYNSIKEDKYEIIEFLKNTDLTIIDECFHYNTLVLTYIGWKKIGDLYHSNRKHQIASYNFEKQEIEFKPLIKKYKHKRKEKILKITIKDDNNQIRTLIVTENHEFVNDINSYKKIKDFKLGEYLYCVDIDSNYFYNYCTKCGLIIKEKNKGVHTFNCRKTKDDKKNIHTKAMEKRSENKKYCEYLSNKMLGNKNPSKKLEIRKKISEAIKKNIKEGKQKPYGRKDFYEYTKHEKMFQEMFPTLEHEIIFGLKGKNSIYGNSWFKVDFINKLEKIIYEIDGKSHNNIKKDVDKRKTDFFISEGYIIIRFTNKEVEKMYEKFKKM